MAVDFHTLIHRNKRNSWLLVCGFMLFAVVVVVLLSYTWSAQAGMDQIGWPFSVAAGGIAFVVTLISTLIAYYSGASAILRISRARQIVKADDPQLFNVVEEMAIAAGLPMPRIYVIEDTAPNAFATGRNPEHGIVAITSGLRTKLTREELQAVMAHEMSHIRNMDIRFALLMATLVGFIVLLCDLFLRSMRFGWRARLPSSGRRSGRGNAGVAILLVIGLILAIVAPLLAKLLELAFSRQREYLADASAVELTRNPQGLASALARISADPEVLEVANRATAPMFIVHPIKQFEDRASSIWDSHPPIKDRIRRILSLEQI